MQAPPRGSHPQCTIHTEICEGGLVTTIYRYGPCAPSADMRFPQLFPDAPPTSRRHYPPKGLRPPPRISVPHLPSLSSREPAAPHWSSNLHPSSPISPMRRRSTRRVHSPTSSIISPSPAALATQESVDLQLPPSFPLCSQYSGTFFSPDQFEASDTASVNARMDNIRLSTSTLLAQVEAEMDAARTISDVHACDVAVSTSGTDWHVDVQLRPTPRSLRASPRGVPAGAAAAAPGSHATLPRVDEHETVSSCEAPRPRVARRLDFEKLSPAAARLLGAEVAAAQPDKPTVDGAEGQAVRVSKPVASGQSVVPPLYPETPTRRFQSYLQQLRDDRPSLEARTATTCAAVDSTATITPRDTARSAGAAAPPPAAAPALLREEGEGSDCSRTVELPPPAGSAGVAHCRDLVRGLGGYDTLDRVCCSGWSLEDDTSDVDVITTCTVSERSQHTSPPPGSCAPPALTHEPRLLWRRRAVTPR